MTGSRWCAGRQDVSDARLSGWRCRDRGWVPAHIAAPNHQLTLNPVYHIPRHQSPMSLDTIKVETIGLGRDETLSVEAKAALACSVLATHPWS